MPKIRVTGFNEPQIITEGDLKTIELARQGGDPSAFVELTSGNFILKDIRAEVYDDHRDADTYLLKELGFTNIKKFPYEYSNSELKEWMGSWYEEYLSRLTGQRSLELAPVPSDDPAIIKWGVDLNVIYKGHSEAKYDYWAVMEGEGGSLLEYERFTHRIVAARTIKERAEYTEKHEINTEAAVTDFPKNKGLTAEETNELLTI